MTTEELITHIDGQREHQNLDFKADCPWDDKKYAKDFLAFANVMDGGSIIVGVEETHTGFNPVGVSPENLSTYNADIMKDQLRRFADPTIDFKVSYPIDNNGKQFVAIEIFPFREMPIISKISIPGAIQHNVIYYRNTDKRTESAPISNAHDLRDIIEMAAVRLMQRRRSFGYTMAESVESELNREIDSQSPTSHIETIRSRGHWLLRFQPLKKAGIEPLSECLHLIDRNKVSMEWTFPQVVIYNINGRVFPSEHSYHGEYSIGDRKESWNFYQSGQFVYYGALVEDWLAESPYRKQMAEKFRPGDILFIKTSLIHFITQVIEFLSRLCVEKIYDEGVQISISLKNTKNRTLYIDDENSSFFLTPKITGAESITYTEKLTVAEIQEGGHWISNKIILYFLERFGYAPTKERIMQDQQRLLLRYMR
ncbi:helix-turn-helix domain-containing protein [Olivibacter jilunii]|uniref:AlbA family DNA-binding domain-containing protein n=1 Tax=Olivibacter jilunii TaxID=985016 RepID=UPI00102FFEC1|nr:ATP-binding protein [Olivibacter jilunii]